jgi:hypothetical protein
MIKLVAFLSFQANYDGVVIPHGKEIASNVVLSQVTAIELRTSMCIETRDKWANSSATRCKFLKTQVRLFTGAKQTKNRKLAKELDANYFSRKNQSGQYEGKFERFGDCLCFFHQGIM